MPVTSTNHGLSVITSQTAQRLALPVPDGYVVTNRFHDSTTVNFYPPYGDPAHNGMDWNCSAGTDVYAMFEGAIASVNPSDTGPHGKYVEVNSSIGGNSVFQHTCRHLDEIPKVAQNGQLVLFYSDHPSPSAHSRELRMDDQVTKGDQIGRSGNTGESTDQYHLHVHFRPYDLTGMFTYENNNVEPVRINGHMNFECFLPSAHGTAITTARPLLSLKAPHNIPVCRPNEDSSVLGVISGAAIGCYTIVGKDADIPARLQIRFTGTQTGWVPVKGRIANWHYICDVSVRTEWRFRRFPPRVHSYLDI